MESLFMDNATTFFPKLIAHRGASAYAPENTLSALQQSSELGAEWVECDVMLDSRGEAIIFHDLKLHRTTNGYGYVSRTPYSVISQLDAGGFFGAKYIGEVVPTLEQWLKRAALLKMGINLELKMASQVDRLVDTVMMNLARFWQTGCPTPLISSQFVECLSCISKYSHYHCLLGYVTKRWKRNWHKILKQFHCVSLHVDHRFLNPKRVQQVKEEDYLLFAYTVNNQNRAKELFEMGVDAIFSNYPDLLLQEDHSG